MMNQVDLNNDFDETVNYGNQLYSNFEMIINKILGDKDFIDENQFDNIKSFKKKLELDFKEQISKLFEIKKIPLSSQQYRLPITESNFEFNILNCFAIFKDRLHNKLNSLRKGNYDG